MRASYVLLIVGLVLLRLAIARRGYGRIFAEIARERAELKRKRTLGAGTSTAARKQDREKLAMALNMLSVVCFLGWLVSGGMHWQRWIVVSFLVAAILLFLGSRHLVPAQNDHCWLVECQVRVSAASGIRLS